MAQTPVILANEVPGTFRLSSYLAFYISETAEIAEKFKNLSELQVLGNEKTH